MGSFAPAARADDASDRFESIGLKELFTPSGWNSLRASFPGVNHDEIQLPGQDVRVILSRMIPDIDKYFQEIIDHLESISVVRQKATMQVEILLGRPAIELSVSDSRKVKTGEPYAARLKKRVRFEIAMLGDRIVVRKIKGIALLLNLPVISDSVYPMKLELDTPRNMLKVDVLAVNRLVRLVAKVDLSNRKMMGLDWREIFARNLPSFFGLFVFFAI